MLVAVIGCGSIGKRHIYNLVSLGVQDVLAYDKDPERLAIAAAECEIDKISSFSEVLSAKPDAVVVCTPTSLHVPIALEAARGGAHLFIEKPVSHNCDGLDELLAEVKKQKLVTMIGSNFKFHPSFLKMKEILLSGVLGKVLSARCQFGQYLPDWHPWEDYRRTYSARSELGGGILLDSHEFDYMAWFLGKVDQVFCLLGKLSDLEIDTEDTAAIILRFKSGTIGEMHLDYSQRTYQRNYEFFGEHGTLQWDFGDRRVWLYSAKGKKWEVFEEPRNYDLNEMYVKEMRHFIDCIQSGTKPVTDLGSGCEVLKAIMAAKVSAKQGQIVSLEERCH